MNKLIYDEKTNTGILEGKICPFRNPLILPGRIAGQMEIQNIPCSTSCALFNVISDIKTAKETICALHCASEPFIINAQIEKINDLKII